MCGRFTLLHKEERLRQLLRLQEIPELELPRFNIAPTQMVLGIRHNAELVLEAVALRWGLIPSWAQDPSIGNRLLNARCETIEEKPSFRDSFRKRRCLIPASGFYEWQKIGTRKQPFYIHPVSDELMAYAGIWDRWHAPSGGVIESCSILTTRANELLQPLHERMPVILFEKQFEHWLDPKLSKASDYKDYFEPLANDQLMMYPVGSLVNKATVDHASLITPYEAKEAKIAQQPSLFD
jgi:putative SOS response-associated peptidase YedK